MEVAGRWACLFTCPDFLHKEILAPVSESVNFTFFFARGAAPVLWSFAAADLVLGTLSDRGGPALLLLPEGASVPVDFDLTLVRALVDGPCTCTAHQSQPAHSSPGQHCFQAAVLAHRSAHDIGKHTNLIGSHFLWEQKLRRVWCQHGSEWHSHLECITCYQFMPRAELPRKSASVVKL